MDDLRRPTGFLFALLGLILLFYGIFSDARAQLDANINVNLWCGLTLLVFGGIMLWLSYRAKS